MSSTRRDERAALTTHLKLSAAAAATTWAAMWSWRDFTTSAAPYLVGLIVVGVGIALTGAVARWRRLPGVLVVLAQVVVGGALTCQVIASRPYPGERFQAALGDAVDAANTYASPVPETDTISVTALLIVGGLVAMLLVDLCAATLRRVPLAGLPLLTVYSVPISLVDRGLSWWVFAACAIGFLVMLFLQEEDHLSRWGRSLDGSTAATRRLSDSVRGSALLVGALATTAAVLVPTVVPTLSFSVFDVGPGNGGDGDIEVTNPMVDLREDLVRGDNIDLITVVTDDEAPDHLRISVLNSFTSNQWSAGNRKVPTANLAQGALPPLEGDPAVVFYTERDYEVRIEEEFRSRWLPTQAPITEIVAAGDWRYDDTTFDFLSSDSDLDTGGLDYRMTAAVPSYSQRDGYADLLALDTSPTDVPDQLTDLPDDLPSQIGAYARAATSEARTDFERAVLLNQFFRETGGFTYELPSDPSAVGTGELVDFLDPEAEGGRAGYCEQFAAAMGVMARTLGIPARVAVGFLKPTPVAGQSNTWVYKAHDLHAWVELYFPDAGWVLFDPTPQRRVGEGLLPAYADAEVAAAAPTAAPTSAPNVPRPVRPELTSNAAPTQAPDQAGATGTDEPGSTSVPWLMIVTILGVLLLVAVLARLPRTVRARQRERRLTAGPESAWEELRATAIDLRLSWPEGRSPRVTRDVVAGWFGRPPPDAAAADDDAAAGQGPPDLRPAHGPGQAPDAAAAIDRIVHDLERLRYSRSHTVEPGSLREDTLLCCAALVAGASPRIRRRATWLPVSVTQRRSLTDLDQHAGGPGAGEPELVGARAEVL